MGQIPENKRQIADILLGILYLIIALPLVLYARLEINQKRPRIGLAVSDRIWDRLQILRFPYDLAITRTGGNVRTFAPRHLEKLDKMLEGVKGLVLSGGEDVDSKHYSGDPGSVRSPNPGRDELELALLQKAAERNIPVLCVCRGAQLLAVWAGGRLESHDHDDELMRNHFTTLVRFAKHTATVKQGSRLHAILGPHSVIKVNSFHHQAIVDSGKLQVTAIDEGKMIEGVELPGDRFVVGVQWHPELQAIFSRRQQRLFDRLVAATQ